MLACRYPIFLTGNAPAASPSFLWILHCIRRHYCSKPLKLSHVIVFQFLNMPPKPMLIYVNGITCSSCVINCLTHFFFITGCHMLACGAMGYTAFLLQVVPRQRIQSNTQLVKIVVLACVFCGAVVLGNVSLNYIPVSFNQVTPLPSHALRPKRIFICLWIWGCCCKPS